MALDFVVLVTFAVLTGATAESDPDVNLVRIDLFTQENHKGDELQLSVETCLDLPSNFRPESIKVQGFASIALYGRESCTGFAKNFTGRQRRTPSLQRENFTVQVRSISPVGGYSLYPRSVIEDYFYPNDPILNGDRVPVQRIVKQNRTRIYLRNVATNATWITKIVTELWSHIQRTYGMTTDRERRRLGVILHVGSAVELNNEASWLERRFGHRNLVHLMRKDPEAFAGNASDPGNVRDLDDLVDSIGRIALNSAMSVALASESGLFEASACAAIIRHDTYRMLKRADWVDLNKKRSEWEEFQSGGPAWFINLFLPTYETYGGSSFLLRYFKLVSAQFPKEEQEFGFRYTRNMTMGELLHFMSGAAGRSLWPQAAHTLGLGGEWEEELRAAKEEFADVKYERDVGVNGVTLYGGANFTGNTVRRVVNTCLNLPSSFRVESVRIAEESDNCLESKDCVVLWFSEGCRGNGFLVSHDISNLGGYQFASVSISEVSNEHPEYLQATWIDTSPTRMLRRNFEDGHVAVYFDNVQPGTSWPLEFLSQVWNYTNSTYGSTQGPSRKRLTVILAANATSNSTVENTYLEATNGYRDYIRKTSTNRDAWSRGTAAELDSLATSIVWIVQSSALGVSGSPVEILVGSSAWNDILKHDIYSGIGREDLVRMNAEKANNSAWLGPAENVYWFRDWFLPIYRANGGAAVITRFWKLLKAEVRQEHGKYAEMLNLGEFVHFWSGAVGLDLSETLAPKAFEWTKEHEVQVKGARRRYKNILY